jgi:asparagine synthase (glutamine-hydrolysing)
MCGICGKLEFDLNRSVSPGLLKSMADTIHHRGPDDEGYYVSGPVGLGFRRLSIIDLKTGHQPLSNEDGAVWIVFNGEIYNYRELREDLLSKGHIFRTQTDTEVIVHLYEEMGEACVQKLRGMFGFAIWDERKRQLLLARDRVGIKPLYYWESGDAIVFGSEIKAILADPAVQVRCRPEIVDRFLKFNYLPGEDTLFENIHKLAPGSTLVVSNGRTKTRQYWDLEYDPAPRSFRQAKDELIEVIDESVRLHMISDVPVGLLLSGGVDSTAMLSLSSSRTEKRLSTFTVGFSSAEIADERPYARMAAERYGTDHHEMTISASDFADFLPKYAWHMEEPVCEAPAVALYYVSKMARESVKVLISGEGGDEAFAGYQTYRGIAWTERLKRVLGPLNRPASALLSGVGRHMNSARANKYAPLLATPFEDSYYSRSSGPATLFNERPMELYSLDFLRKVNLDFAIEPIRRCMHREVRGGCINRMLYTDTKTSLPDALLLKADRMTMATSIELRVPLLDHKVLEFAARLPENFKVRGFSTKHIMKKAFEDRIPEPILNRRKTGFPVPFGRWFQTDLRNFVHDLLLDRRAMDRGYFNPARIEKLVREQSESGRYSTEVFSLISLELWHREFLDRRLGGGRVCAPAGTVAPAFAQNT